mgnify:CR=1 FL=1
MKIKRILSRLVVLMAMMLSVEMSAEGKIKYRERHCYLSLYYPSIITTFGGNKSG